MIVFSNAIIDPATVMIKIEDALIADVTMLAFGLGHYFTVRAEGLRFIL